jgi:hypothetical protein
MTARLACAGIMLFVAQSLAFGQEPVPRDTTRVPADTTRAVPDTSTAPVIQDSVRPIPQLARHFFPPALGLSDGVWEWDQQALLLEASTSLADLLERIPGIFTVRTGLLIQPEAAAAFGGTANRLEVFLDGYALDPLTEASVDLTKIELANIERVRVERRIGLIRVHIETLMPKDTRTYSRVEAGVSEPEGNMFRGILLAPKLFVGPLGLALDRLDTDGFGRNEPGDHIGAWVKYSYIRGQSGLQVEYRRVSTDRDDVIPWPAEHIRDDLIARLRLNIRDGIVAELFGGRTTFEADTADPAEAEDTLPKISEDVLQYGGRVSISTPFVWGRGALRFRDNDALPSMQLDGAAGVRISETASVSAEITQADWRDAGSAMWYSVTGQVRPISVLRIFGEYTGGDRGAPFLFRDRAFVNEFSGYRAGGELNWRGISVGAAALRAESDSSVGFGLPFDTATTSFGSFSADGFEVSGSLALPFVRGLALSGHVTNWYKGFRGWYLPQRLYRAGLHLHTSPLPSGNLELFGRIEAVHRGNMVTPADTLAADNTVDAYLQIRIIDVRLFGRFEDILGNNAVEVPGRTMLGPRLFYGVKWQFWN